MAIDLTRARRRAGRLRRRLRRLVRRQRIRPHPELVRITDEDVRFLTTLHDDRVPLPPGALRELNERNPLLRRLRRDYDGFRSPANAASRWHTGAVEDFLDLRYFRGETLFVWHYRELPRITALKYFVLASYVRGRDELGLLERLDEDGAFGCWTFSYEGLGRVSRDLLESVNELNYLDRQLSLAGRESFSVLDIGAGYGRLAHRMCSAFSNVADYCCVDAIPESTFLSGWYLRYRNCSPPARAVPLPSVEATLASSRFDLAVNVHSFSECTFEAIRWWLDLVAAAEVPHLFIVPNEPDALLSLEEDGSRIDYAPLIEARGYRLVDREPVVADPAVRDLVRLHDQFHLFSR